MVGIDKNYINSLNYSVAIGRINADTKTDFILSPHHLSVYEYASEQLWERVSNSLKSGDFQASLPITIEVPKQSGLTRPGSILLPQDRILYQALIDEMAPFGEETLNRSRVFSNILRNPDPDHLMFESSHTSWDGLQQAISNHCNDEQHEYAIKADISSFFERLYQHNLINLLSSSGCLKEGVNLLEKLLLAWMEKNSHGILQGMFPSDFLGNFYLLVLDSDAEVRGIQSARYVDDFYFFFKSQNAAQRQLVNLTKMLRREGLSLNEQKTKILPVEELIREESQVDILFSLARQEIENDLIQEMWYESQGLWFDLENDPEISKDIETKALQNLYNQIEIVDRITANKIEKFCLPIFSLLKSEIGIERCLRRLPEQPDLTKTYSSYLARFIGDNFEVSDRIQKMIINDELAYDWQIMWTIAMFYRLEDIQSETVNQLIRLLRDGYKSEALRGLCAVTVGKFGNPGQRRILRNRYHEETSEYVRSAILYSSRYFPTAERRTAISAWGGHSIINSLISESVKNILK